MAQDGSIVSSAVYPISSRFLFTHFTGQEKGWEENRKILGRRGRVEREQKRGKASKSENSRDTEPSPLPHGFHLSSNTGYAYEYIGITKRLRGLWSPLVVLFCARSPSTDERASA
jgi:hypothetical protein